MGSGDHSSNSSSLTTSMTSTGSTASTPSTSSLSVTRECKSEKSKVSSSSSLDIAHGWFYLWDSYPDVVRMIILSSNYDRICMLSNGRPWDFPRFRYVDEVSRGRALEPCYSDLRAWFGDDWKNTRFWFTSDFLGKYYITSDPDTKSRRTMRAYAYFVEFVDTNQIDEMHLPEGSAWIDQKAFEEIMRDPNTKFKGLMRTVRDSMVSLQQNRTIFANLTDPRQQLGWHTKASSFLREAACTDGAEVIGDVVHHHLTSTSTILKVETSHGWYFLKSPGGGCNEVEITATVASLFPDLVPRVISWSKALNCFVSPPFTNVSPPPQELIHVVRRAASIHHGSRGHIEYLAEKGVPTRSVKSLIRQIESWIKREGVVGDEWLGLEARDQLSALLPFVKKLGKGLSRSEIPMTLVHGDLDVTNSTYEPGGKSEDPTCLLFDWQYAYIGHPFCDFHRMRAYLPEKCIDQYLLTWSSVMNLDRARALFERCWILGKFFKLMSLGEWYEAGQAGPARDAQRVFFRHVESFYNTWVVEKNAFNSTERHTL